MQKKKSFKVKINVPNITYFKININLIVEKNGDKHFEWGNIMKIEEHKKYQNESKIGKR